MKTSYDPRHQRRQHLIQEIFSTEFHKQKVSDESQEIVNHSEFLDKEIQAETTNAERRESIEG